MTYPYDSIFMLMDAGFVFDGNICSDHSSRTELKRGKEWIMDATGQGQFNNKERTVEDVATKPSVPGVFPEVVSWWNAKNSGDPLNSGHINDQLLSVNVHENVAPFGSVDDMNRETGHDSSRSLPVSHGKMNPSFGGIEESQASPVGHSNNSMSLATGSSFLTGGYENYNHYNNILPPVLVSEHSFGSNIGDDFALPGESFMRSMLMTFNQEYGDLICQKYDKSDEHFIPFGLPKGHSSFMLQYENLDSGAYKPVMDPSYDRELGTSSLLGQENGTLLPMASTYPEANSFLIPMLENCNEEHSNLMDNYVNDNIGYGGFQERPAMNTSGGNTSSHMIVNRYQNPVQASTAPVQKDAVFSGAHPIANRAPINPRKKTLKKANQLASDYFPANVKSLLSTGIFDGVPVKYVSWSRDKCLRGVISGTGYLCSCNECNNLRIINAYEFEQHAGCKTKHPNNHIYFESGKTIYAVVLELRKTPPEMLLEKILTAAGSPVNEKNFLAWKVAYEALADELEQIDKEKEANTSLGGMQPAVGSG